MPNKRPKRNINDPNIREHLDYEIDMFRQVSKLLIVLNGDTGILKNALVESFAIHARNLYDFLYGPNYLHEDDIIAVDFLEQEKRKEFEGKIENPEYKSVTKKMADKQIAHLTTLRYSDENNKKKQWPFMKIINEIEKKLNIFFEYFK